jgi:Ribbon-helix-helix protein, copG family
MADMVFHMKTTLVIPDQVMTRLKEEAARQGTTISALVEAALRAYLRRPGRKPALPPLPSFRGGQAGVDIADREALDQALGDD